MQGPESRQRPLIHKQKYVQRGPAPPAVSADSHIISRKSEHSELLINGLNSLRCAKQLFDVTLIVEDQRFQAHRAALAACSDYFCAMFSDAMLESRQQEIELSGLNAIGLQLLIEYIYTSSIELTPDNVQDVLVAASHIQLRDVVDECSKFLELQIDLDNCVSIAALAEMYSLESLKRKTFRYICARLKEVYKRHDLTSVSYDQMENILKGQYPVNCTEEVVLQVLLQYCVTNEVAEEKFKHLLKHIDYINIPEESLRKVLQPEKTEDLNKCPREMREFLEQHRKFIMDIHKSHGAKSLSETKAIVPRNVVQNPRGMEMALVMIGGFETSGLNNRINCHLPSKGKWFNLTVIPHIEQCNFGSTVLGNDLYIVGGSYDVCLREYIHPFGFRYCPSKHLWTSIAPIQTERCRFSLTAVAEQYLYAVGGVSETLHSNETEGIGENLILGGNATNCERYNSVTDSWEYMPPLAEKRSQHAGAVHKDNLYIGGGLDGFIVLSSFWSFSHSAETWTKLASMPTARADHVLFTSEGLIYACGGWNEDSITENRVIVPNIDVYNIERNEWRTETRNPSPRFYSGLMPKQRKIYYIGGLLSKFSVDRATAEVDCYDLDTKEWTSGKEVEYPKEVWECSGAAFYVPKDVDNFKYYWEEAAVCACRDLDLLG